MATSPNFSADIELAIKAALAAGSIVNDIYQSKFSVNYRDNEPVTEADSEANDAITGILSGSYPILSEESDEKNISYEKCWIIDPLDGTTDFVRRTGEFTVMVGLLENFNPIGGVIYAPGLDSLYAAEAGKGAYLKFNNYWQKIMVNDNDDVSKFTLLMSRNHISPQEEIIAGRLGCRISSLGSSLKVCRIAQGEAELYFTTTDRIKVWDTCAANCILAEAGGKMTDIDGDQLDYGSSDFRHKKGIVASNNRIHGKIIKIIKDMAII